MQLQTTTKQKVITFKINITMERSKELSMDEVFLQKLTDAVFSNLNNEQFGAEELAKLVGISRSQIHRKLQKINGKSITQFIREIKLEEALKLLQRDVGTSSEISYRVGFSSPVYFTKYFHEYFGCPPSEVKRKIETTFRKNVSSEEEHSTIIQISRGIDNEFQRLNELEEEGDH